MSRLCISNLTIKTDGETLVENASLDLAPGDLTVILGPNGAGKSSLIKGALGLWPAQSGSSRLNDVDIKSLSPIERARQIAYLPQIRPLAWPNLVRDVVSLGRFSHGATVGRLRGEDADAVARALSACDLAHLAGRTMDSLSGGEMARVHCARAMASEAPLMIADEPIASLDPRHQFRILDLFQSFVQSGRGALLVLHDIELAARYATRLVWIKDGHIVANGPPSKTLTPERLAHVFGVSARIESGKLYMDGAA